MSNSVTSTDVIIVGTGAAGLFCALHLPENLSIYMLTKDTLENSASYLAQGGIAALKDSEDYEDYFEDTLRAGHYENSRKAVDTMIRQSPVIIRELLDYHVNFDKKGDDLDLTKEGGHSASRILHHEDITGQEITSKLLQNVREKKNIDLHEHTTMIDLICEKDVVLQRDGECVTGDVAERRTMLEESADAACRENYGLAEYRVKCTFRILCDDALTDVLLAD